MHYAHHRIRLSVGLFGADSLVAVRVQLLAQRVDFADLALLEGGQQLFQRQVDAEFEVFELAGLVLKRHFQAVLDRDEFGGEFFDGKLLCLGHFFHATAALVFSFGLGAQKLLFHFC
ncbi:hypothetical protein D3C78_1465100 [compost metagenome]